MNDGQLAISKFRCWYLDDPRITPKLQYSADGKTLDITLEIAEVSSILSGIYGRRHTGASGKASEVPDRPEKRQAILDARMRDDVYALRQYYFDFGYMNASIDVSGMSIRRPAISMSCIILTARILCMSGRSRSAATSRRRMSFIRRELKVYPGERFNGAKIKRSKERIYNLGFFENVAFDTETTEKPEVQNLVVTVKESKTGDSRSAAVTAPSTSSSGSSRSSSGTLISPTGRRSWVAGRT